MKKDGSSSEYRLHQWANDWISVDGPNGAEILNPLTVTLAPDEMERIQEYSNNVGMFWKLYELTDSGRLIRKRKD
jgi:hypothetical protein